MIDAKVYRAMATDPRIGNVKAQEMHLSAKLFVQDARDLGDRNSAGQYVLAIHGIELALKAFLHRKGVSLDELERKHRHNLRKLLDDAYDQGLPRLDADSDQMITELNKAGEKARIRYEFSFGLPISMNAVTVADLVLAGTAFDPPPL